MKEIAKYEYVDGGCIGNPDSDIGAVVAADNGIEEYQDYDLIMIRNTSNKQIAKDLLDDGYAIAKIAHKMEISEYAVHQLLKNEISLNITDREEPYTDE